MAAVRLSKRPLRADAVRNQARVLKAAHEVFMKYGLDAPLDHVAEHAGVGVATLYRRFPDRESLIVAIFEHELRRTVELARRALATADPWEGFTSLLNLIFEAVSTDKGMRQAMLSSRYGLSAAKTGRNELVKLMSLLIKRAQDDGSLRQGVTAQDIPPMMLMVGAVADFAQDVNPNLWKRYSALLIDGLSTGSKQSKLSLASFSETEIARAMALW